MNQRLAGRSLAVVSNREPYIHRFKDGSVEIARPAGGLTSALDPVMRACGGTWFAHGSGDADHLYCDARGRIEVPPGDPRYTLRRVWLTREQEEGYYYGFSNRGLWPLCHQVYQRPFFDENDWSVYRSVNRLFADTILDELGQKDALIFIQDYHFALLPLMLKQARPNWIIAHFWHIPWPNPDTFRICPWGDELLRGLLGCDLLGFQIQYHCNLFFETVDRTLEARVDREHFSVIHRGRETRVKPFPISVDPGQGESHSEESIHLEATQVRKQYGLEGKKLILGIDRVDYTKGIPERLLAFEALLTRHPELVGQVRLIQIGAPSRTHIANYRDLHQEIETLVDRINWKFGSGHETPILFLNRHADQDEVQLWYRLADVCLVSSLHDGMNLVAKEFVAARQDEEGVLVLSRFTGAARELGDALLINPFDISEMANILAKALFMPLAEKQRRMRSMRAKVEDNNIFRWAGMLLSEALKVQTRDILPGPVSSFPREVVHGRFAS